MWFVMFWELATWLPKVVCFYLPERQIGWKFLEGCSTPILYFNYFFFSLFLALLSPMKISKFSCYTLFYRNCEMISRDNDKKEMRFRIQNSSNYQSMFIVEIYQISDVITFYNMRHKTLNKFFCSIVHKWVQ